MEYKFEVGDKVKIIKGGSGCSPSDRGKIVTVIKLGTYFGNPGYKIDPPLEGNASTGEYEGMAGENSFELVQSVAMGTLKVGDKVVIDNLKNKAGGTLNGRIGFIGTISKIEGDWYTLAPHCPGGCFLRDNLKKIYAGEEICTTGFNEAKSLKGIVYKFNVGDRVKCIKSGSGLTPQYIGRYYTIIERGIYGSSGERPGYRIDPPHGNTDSSSYKGFNGEASFELASPLREEYSPKWEAPSRWEVFHKTEFDVAPIIVPVPKI